MGGDDLGSDDEYLSKPSKGATGASVDYDVEDSQKDQKRKKKKKNNNERRRREEDPCESLGRISGWNQ
jgi:hypothetical protein